MEGVERAIGPVGGEEGALVFGGEFGAGAEDGARGRAGADVDHGGKAVGVVSGPATGAAAPTVIAGVDDVVDARGNVPRRTLVPFHVGVVGEEFAVLVEGDVELVAETESEELDGFALRVHAADVAAGGVFAFGVAASVPHAREEMIFIPADGAGFVQVGGKIGVIAVGEVDGLAVGREREGVRAVLTAKALGLAEELDLVELIVAVGVAHAPDAAAIGDLVDHDVEAVESVEQAVRTDRGREAIGAFTFFRRGREGFGIGAEHGLG